MSPVVLVACLVSADPAGCPKIRAPRQGTVASRIWSDNAANGLWHRGASFHKGHGCQHCYAAAQHPGEKDQRLARKAQSHNPRRAHDPRTHRVADDHSQPKDKAQDTQQAVGHGRRWMFGQGWPPNGTAIVAPTRWNNKLSKRR